MQTLITKPTAEYELLDSGEGEKLERYDAVILVRPDPQALWARSLSRDVWSNAHAVFVHEGSRGKWNIKKSATEHIQEKWQVQLSGVICTLKLSPFKHVGIFPEQSVHWTWLSEIITKHLQEGRKKISVLNLFGYTGGASIAAALAGATVTHVDASESTVAWSKLNRAASGLPDDAIRFIVDDARKFVEREIRRGNTYDIIILDPPIYGRGAKNELWKIEDDLVPLLSKIKKLLSSEPIAVLLNGYAAGYSHVAYAQTLASVTDKLGGTLTSGELMIEESSPSARLLPCGIFAKWVSIA